MLVLQMLNESATVDVSTDCGGTPEYGNMETIFSESKINIFRNVLICIIVPLYRLLK